MKAQLILILCFPLSLNAQTWYGFSAGGNLTTVAHQNSQFEKYKNLKGYPGATVTFLYQTHLPGATWQSPYTPSDLLTTEVGFKSAHIKDRTDVHLTTWTFNYLTASFGARHYHRPREVLNFYFGGAMVADVLLSGTQLTPSGPYNLARDIRRVTVGATADAGLLYRLTHDNYCSFGIGYQRGVTSVEKNRDKLAWLHSWKVSVAMIIALKSSIRIKKK